MKHLKFKKILNPAFFVLGVLLMGVLLFELNFFFLDPIHMASEKVKFSDIYFSKLNGEATKADDRIIIIDVGDTMKRPNIVNVLYKLKNSKYKVLGIDLNFAKINDEDQNTDSLLIAFANNSPNTIFAFDEYNGGSFFFRANQKIKKGIVNLGKEKEDYPVRTILNKSEKYPESHSFAYEIVKSFNPELTSLTELKKKEEIDINYQKQVLPITITAEDLLKNEESFISKYLEDKIVIVGSLKDENYDVHLVPNAGYASFESRNKIYTELQGPYIHAIAISMLLDQKTINKSLLFDWLVYSTVFITTLLLTLYWEHRYHLYMRLISRIYILIGSLLLFVLYIFLMKFMLFEFPVSGAVLTLILTHELTEIYEPIKVILKKIKLRVQNKF